jgi:carboxyl-terminal processing protease
MTSKARLSVLLVSTPVLAFVIVGGLLGQERASGDRTLRHLRVFDDVVSLVMSNYVEEVRMDRALEGAMRGLADGLDPDSAYLDARQARAVAAGEGLPDGEVGLELTRQYYLRVIASRDGSPAARAGLRTGDFIRAIDGRPTRDMSVFEGTRLLRGTPGSSVTLTVIRGNAADPHEVELVRERVTGRPVTSRMIDEQIGYLRVATLRDGAPDEVRAHATALVDTGATSLLIDLRQTAEGPLENGIAAARLFVRSGTLAIKAGRDEADRVTITTNPTDGALDIPLSLLISAGTSGAAELFVAALDGNGRADVLGERTLGRVGVQKFVPLPENRGLWLTHARYLTPAGEPIHGRGLEPKVRLESPEIEFGVLEPVDDKMLDSAIEHIRTRSPA